SDWNLKKDKDGIKIYTRSVEGSSFEEYKAITTIEKSTMNKVLMVILDVKNYESLFPDCMNPKVLKQEGEYDCIVYTQTKGPFPVKDRDSVFEQKTHINNNGKYAKISLMVIPGYFAEDKNFVRIRKGSGYWELTAEDNENVKVIYQFHGEPGGEIPAWLVNSFVVGHPFETLKNLKNRVKTNN
ncbi:MAG: hypothetical protein EP310_05230, partial [Bacteroidetes bacterium]